MYSNNGQDVICVFIDFSYFFLVCGCLKLANANIADANKTLEFCSVHCNCQYGHYFANFNNLSCHILLSVMKKHQKVAQYSCRHGYKMVQGSKWLMSLVSGFRPAAVWCWNQIDVANRKTGTFALETEWMFPESALTNCHYWNVHVQQWHHYSSTKHSGHQYDMYTSNVGLQSLNKLKHRFFSWTCKISKYSQMNLNEVVPSMYA